MSYPLDMPATAFDGTNRIAAGTLADVVPDVQRYLARAPEARVAVYADETGERLDLDLRGTEQDALARLDPAREPVLPEAPPPAPRGPGRPRLGVIAREVTLLPRHWEWLNTQPGGASAALRRLVDDARKANEAKESARRAQEAAYRFMLAAGGDLPGYEEALRALFAGDVVQFEHRLASWPPDLRNHAIRLAFGTPEARRPPGSVG
ncbi:DUF2239 family protein [Verticiella sediminum]|uniref:DUF2239 family protein n=1 Tax=Verticiella sediminum TaxID=1247510 RepID=A0A556A7Q1_9BURK|nr:DUF2239 family protein [Verticiella sediminum]TSH88895.1 DUF2239 family protein [Verticiella sediminum]